MIENNSRIEILHQNNNRRSLKEAQCKLTTPHTRKGVVQKRSHMKREKRDLLKMKIEDPKKWWHQADPGTTRQWL